MHLPGPDLLHSTHAPVFHERCYWSMVKPSNHKKLSFRNFTDIASNDHQKPSKFTLPHARPPTRSITDAMFAFAAFSISWTRLSAPQAVSSDRLNICRLACIWKCLDTATDRTTEVKLLQNHSYNVSNLFIKTSLVKNR